MATAKAAPVLPPLPEGYDWSLSLGDDFELASAELNEVSADERHVTRAYFAACEKKLGTLPLETFACSDAQPMPVTGAENLGVSWPRAEGVSLPGSLAEIARCDRPSLIYRDMRNVGCSSGSRIRRVSTATTDWSYICRKGHSFFADANLYSEIGLIGNNRSTGETCFFAGRSAVNLSISQRKSGAARAELSALTGQRMHAPSSDAGVVNWSVPQAPGCTACHSQGPWLSFPFVDGKNSYAELRWRKDSAGDPQIERFFNQGYIEADGKPVVPARHAGMLYAPLYPSELPELRGQSDYVWPRALRLDPSTEGARMCTTCHHIGNESYVSRYPRAVFYFSAPFDSKEPNRQRSDLYLANLTDSLRGSHNTRMLSPPWMEAAAAQVAGFASSERIDPDTVRKHNPAIEAALEKLSECARSAQCWTEHWTLARIEAEPLRYLRETCSNCHATDAKTLVPLTTKQEFLKGGNAWSRLNNAERPHPPGGRLEASILEVLGRYLAR